MLLLSLSPVLGGLGAGVGVGIGPGPASIGSKVALTSTSPPPAGIGNVAPFAVRVMPATPVMASVPAVIRWPVGGVIVIVMVVPAVCAPAGVISMLAAGTVDVVARVMV